MDKIAFLCKGRRFDKLKKVINEVSNINERKSDNWTALHLATLNDHCECVSYLLANGADPLLKTDKDKTALELAILQNNKCVYEILHHLCKAEPFNKIRDSLYNEKNIGTIPEELPEGFCGLTILDLSIIFENDYLFEKYCKKEKNVLDFYQNSALHYCSVFGKLKFLKSLIQIGAKINQVNTHKSTPLLLASRHCYSRLVHELITHDAKLRSNNRGTNPIHYACFKGSVKTLSELLASENGKKMIDRPRNDGSTPIHLAILGDSIPCLELLYFCEANFAIPNSLGEYPIYIAAKKKNEEVVEFVLNISKNITFYDTNQTTALHYSACRNDVKILKLLLKSKKIPINCKDSFGNTPLHIAAENNHYEVIKALLKYDPDHDLKNKIGLTPKDIVKESRCKKVLKWYWKDKSKLFPEKIEKIELEESFETHLKLFWKEPKSFEKITGYNILVKGGDFQKNLKTEDTTITINSLKTNQGYKIKIYATNCFGDGSVSKNFVLKQVNKILENPKSQKNNNSKIRLRNKLFLFFIEIYLKNN